MKVPVGWMNQAQVPPIDDTNFYRLPRKGSISREIVVRAARKNPSGFVRWSEVVSWYESLCKQGTRNMETGHHHMNVSHILRDWFTPVLDALDTPIDGRITGRDGVPIRNYYPTGTVIRYAGRHAMHPTVRGLYMLNTVIQERILRENVR